MKEKAKPLVENQNFQSVLNQIDTFFEHPKLMDATDYESIRKFVVIIDQVIDYKKFPVTEFIVFEVGITIVWVFLMNFMKDIDPTNKDAFIFGGLLALSIANYFIMKTSNNIPEIKGQYRELKTVMDALEIYTDVYSTDDLYKASADKIRELREKYPEAFDHLRAEQKMIDRKKRMSQAKLNISTQLLQREKDADEDNFVDPEEEEEEDEEENTDHRLSQ
jgi:hypothetical protein